MKAARSPYIVVIMILNLLMISIAWGLMSEQAFLSSSLFSDSIHVTGISFLIMAGILIGSFKMNVVEDFSKIVSILSLFTLISFIIPSTFMISHTYTGIEYQIVAFVLLLGVVGISLPPSRLLTLLSLVAGSAYWIVFQYALGLSTTATIIMTLSLSYALLLSHPGFHVSGSITGWIKNNFSLHFAQSLELLKSVFIVGILVYAIQLYDTPSHTEPETEPTKAHTFSMEGSWKMRHIGYYNISIVDQQVYPLLEQYERIDTLFIDGEDNGFISFEDSEEKLPCRIDTANHIIEVPALQKDSTSLFLEITYEISPTGDMIMRHKNEHITLIFSK